MGKRERETDRQTDRDITIKARIVGRTTGQQDTYSAGTKGGK
jgi:hypothetical protein